MNRELEVKGKERIETNEYKMDRKNPRVEMLKRFSIRYGFLIVMAVLFVFFGIMEPAFWRPANLFSILLGVTVYGILALGVTFPLVADDVPDLSIGAVAALSVMISAYLMVVLELSGIVAILASIALGAMIGLFNGLLVVKVKIPGLLATLGMMFLVQGLQLIPSGGRSIGKGATLAGGKVAEGQFSDFFLFLGQGRIGIIPTPVVIMLVIAVVVFVILSLSRWGRIFSAIGSNAEAARLVGARVSLYRILAYTLSGTIASIGGIVLAARVGRGDVQSGGTLLLDAIGSALIGFAVLGVRRPNPFGTIVGAIFIGLLLNGLTMMNMPYFVQDFIKGLVLVAALAFTFGLSKQK